VADSSPAGNNETHLAGLYRTIALNFIDEIKANPRDGFDTGKKQIRDFLPDLSRRGSGDDVSIAALIDMEALKELEPILRKQLADANKDAMEPGPKPGIIPLQKQAYSPDPQQYGQFIDVKG
jgi:hypothetical protein